MTTLKVHASPFGFHLIDIKPAPTLYIVTISMLTSGIHLTASYCSFRSCEYGRRRIWNENHTEDPANVPTNEDQASNDDDEGVKSGVLPEAMA